MTLAGHHHSQPQRGAKRRRLSLRAGLVLAAAALVPLNWLVQVARKPSELAGLVIPARDKSPKATWAAYGGLFEENATSIMTPELLAALAQTESAGNPVARTYWRWNWTLDPSRMFTPASSAVGLFQVTDGTFGRCRGLCIHDGKVARAGRWYDPQACWFNGLYNRLIPAHQVEMMSACLHWQTENLMREGGLAHPELALEQDVAAVSHLCGPRAKVVDKLKRGVPVARGLRCGDQDPLAYLNHVRRLKNTFAELRRGR